MDVSRKLDTSNSVFLKRPQTFEKNVPLVLTLLNKRQKKGEILWPSHNILTLACENAFMYMKLRLRI